MSAIHDEAGPGARAPGPAAPGEPRLRLAAVGRRFGSTEALRDVDLDAAAGTVHALLGVNGAGKTTLLRIVAGLTRPSTGRVTIWDGGTAVAASWDSRRLVGLVPAGDRTFYYRLSGRRNLAFFAALHGLSRDVIHSRVASVLERVGLTDAADVRVGSYSHGMIKRLAIARALLTTPPVLLIDEATHDLDPGGSVRVRDMIRSYAAGGTTVLWATQRLDELRGFADTVTVLVAGSVRFQGPIEELIRTAHAAPRFVVDVRDGSRSTVELARDLQHALGTAGHIRALDGDRPGRFRLELAQVELGPALSRLAGADVVVTSCAADDPSIEDAFIRLTEDAPDEGDG